jgi:hypothetical protein
MTNVLVFPCGSEIALEVYNSLNDQKGINLFGASSVADNGQFVFENYIDNVPFINDPKFTECVKAIVEANKIHYIIPCMDVAISKLKEIEPELGCKVLSSELETVRIFSEKKKTYEYFKDTIRVPVMYDSSFLDRLKYSGMQNPHIELPLFSKPNIGASSRGVFKINDLADYEYAIKKYPDNIILEYLPGEEYTVDCFTNKNGKLLFVGARCRTRISNGISVGSIEYHDSEINHIANKINDHIRINGSWFFQLKRDKDGCLCLLEIADRFGGTSVLNRVLGVNFAYLNILNENHDVTILRNTYQIEIGRSLDIKVKNNNLTYDHVYMDYDDTLIVKNNVNIEAIKFIYTCINKKIPVTLLTKHKGDLDLSLEHYKIPKSLFLDILHINKNEKKSNYIKHINSILIDDSFSERVEVSTALNIPVISVENVKYI